MNSELLTIINYMERDRGVNRELIIRAIESALESVVAKKLDCVGFLRVEINRKSLTIKAFRTYDVSDTEEGPSFITLEKAREIKPDAVLGERFEKEIPPSIIGRIGVQNARQMILQNIRQAERDNLVSMYKDRVGEIVCGTVRNIARRGDVIVDLDGSEAWLPARERIPGEDFDVGDTIRALVYRVQSGTTPQGGPAPAIVLSRSCPDFLKALFVLEVSEIAEGVVEIMGVARDPGSRAKIAVRSHDDKVDPVGACVGLRGTRVRNVVSELNGEKVDIVRWSPDIRQYAAQALSPAKLLSVTVVDEERQLLEAIVAADQLSLAIGRKGQNVRLTTRLIGWHVDIKSPEEDQSFQNSVQKAIDAFTVLGVSQEEALALVQGGYTSPEGVADPSATFAQICEDTGLPEEDVVRIKYAVQMGGPAKEDQ